MIYQCEKPRERLEVGFPKFVGVFKTDPDAFMKDVLTKFGNTYQTLITPTESKQRYGDKSSNLIEYLRRLDNSDWIPVAIEYLSQDALTKPQAETFLWYLERLAYFMFVMRNDINTRIARYAKALTELKKGMAPDDPKNAVNLTAKEKSSFIDELDGNIYEKARVRLPILLRLDAAFSDGTVSYHPGVITVEHVMPQNPSEGSEWRSIFNTDEERDAWTHRLGNLVLLSRAKNAQASNLDFDRKKKEYFSSKGHKGPAVFNLTTMVIHEKQWDKYTIERRQLEMLTNFSNEWDLNIADWALYDA
jgi:hypothetical protein